MRELFIIGFRNLVQHRKRTVLLGSAIAGVTTLLVFLLCLTSGVHSTMLESATTLATGHINVGGFYKVTAGQSAPVITDYKKLAEIVRKTIPGELDFVAARGRGWAKLVSESGSVQVAIGGLDIQHEPGFLRVVHAVSGKVEDLAQPNTVLVFEQQAKKLNLKVGDSVVLSSQTMRGTYNAIDLRVVAVAQDMGIMSAWNIFVSDSSLRLLYQLNDETTGALHVYLRDLKRIPQDLDLLRKAFSDAGYILMDRQAAPFWQKFESVNREDWTGQKLDLTTWEEEMSFFKWTVTAIDGLTVVLISVLLVIIAIGIMNSMWIAIRERTREIGTLRAIGMQRVRVLSMFLIEAFTLSALASCVGLVLGLILSGIVSAARIPVPQGAQMFLMANVFKFDVEFARLLGGISIIVFCTTLISLIPAFHAARMKPIQAMQHIG